MKPIINTPEGTRDRLFTECQERRAVQAILTQTFRSYGYDEVITPEVEFYDLFIQSGSPMPQEYMLKIIDRSGKIMVMRPDCTMPIVRLAATRLRALPLPQRLFYDQTVFRSGKAHQGGSSEIAQCGVELIGATGPKGDLEALALAKAALSGCGLAGFHLELGHVAFFRELVWRLGLDEQAAEQIRALIEGKNFAALNDLLQPLAHLPACAALKRLPYLFGGIEVLDEAEVLAGRSESLEELRQIYRELEGTDGAKWLRFDLGMVHQIDYYTGLVFRAYAAGAGDAILSGGRYDGLLSRFGLDAPAIGFAIDVDAVGKCLPTCKAESLCGLIHYGPGGFRQAMDALTQLAGRWELSCCDSLSDTLTLARAKGASQVRVLDNGDWKETIQL